MSNKQSSHLISLHENDLYLLDLNQKTSSKLDLPFTLPSRSEPICILHCRGKLCITLKGNNELVILSPGLKEFKRIPIVELDQTTNLLGFGYDQVSDDFKIVTIINGKTFIYSFKDNSWRQSVPAPFLDCKFKERTGTVSDHCMYWIGDRSHVKKSPNNILCFDFVKEEYRTHETPFYVDTKFGSWLGVSKGDFCLIDQYPCLNNDIYVWSPERGDKEIKVWNCDHCINTKKSLKGCKKIDVGFVCIARDNEVFIVVKGRNGEDKVMVYNKGEKMFIEIPFGTSPLKGFRCMTNYISQ